MTFLRMNDIDLKDKRVLIREDLNVPLNDDGSIAASQRLEAALPTLRAARDAGARVLVASHLGRPEEGTFDQSASLEPVAQWLSEALETTVPLKRDWLDGVEVEPGQIVLLENVRFNLGEKANDEALARKMAALCDVFVMDAFGTAHRAQASTHGVARYAPVAAAGPLLAAELDALAKAMQAPARPLLAIVGGAKVSTKLELLSTLIDKVDMLIVGGGIANTFLAASGLLVGKSLYEQDLVPAARRILAQAKERGVEIPLPTDVAVASQFSAEAKATIKAAKSVSAEEMILDIGPATALRYGELIKRAGTVVWNGPVGVVEVPAFGQGTEAVALAIAASSAFSIAGGGDTLAAVEKYGVEPKISYISTGGGAFLEFLEGKTLPAVAMLEERARG